MRLLTDGNEGTKDFYFLQLTTVSFSPARSPALSSNHVVTANNPLTTIPAAAKSIQFEIGSTHVISRHNPIVASSAPIMGATCR